MWSLGGRRVVAWSSRHPPTPWRRLLGEGLLSGVAVTPLRLGLLPPNLLHVAGRLFQPGDIFRKFLNDDAREVFHGITPRASEGLEQSGARQERDVVRFESQVRSDIFTEHPGRAKRPGGPKILRGIHSISWQTPPVTSTSEKTGQRDIELTIFVASGSKPISSRRSEPFGTHW